MVPASLLLIVVIAALAFIMRSPLFLQDSQVMIRLSNFSHLIIFGVLSLGWLHWFRLTRHWLSDQPTTQYVLAAGFSLVLALLTEVIQIDTPRTASIEDFGLNILGIFMFLSCHAIYDPALALRKRLSSTQRRLFLLASFVLTLFIFAPVMDAMRTSYLINRQLPVLYDFDADWEFQLTTQLDTTLAPFPDGGATASFAANEFSSVLFTNFARDWREYRYLEIALRSTASKPVELAVLVYDKRYIYEWEDGYVTKLELQPGDNIIRLPLSTVAQGPKHRTMEMCCVHGIELIRDNKEDSLLLQVYKIRLLKDKEATDKQVTKEVTGENNNS